MRVTPLSSPFSLTAAARRFYVFTNEHFRPTYVDRKPNESPNDRNDRAIRVAAAWYASHVAHLGIPVVLLTNDRGNRDLAVAEGIACLTIEVCGCL